MSESKTADAQSNIEAVVVARMIQDFYRHFDGTYPTDVMTSSLCAVGPLQSMIGLAIKNGRLKVVTEADAEMEAAWGSWA